MSSAFDWCATGDHQRCKRAHVARDGVNKGEVRICRCVKRSCACAVASAFYPEERVQAQESEVQ